MHIPSMTAFLSPLRRHLRASEAQPQPHSSRQAAPPAPAASRQVHRPENGGRPHFRIEHAERRQIQFDQFRAILSVDRTIEHAARGERQEPDRVYAALSGLLDADFFRPANEAHPPEKYFDQLHACPLDADDKTIRQHAQRFAERVVSFRQARYEVSNPVKPVPDAKDVARIAGLAERHLNSNRVDGHSFRQEVAIDPRRRLTQKMGLETILQSFPLLQNENRKVDLLKKLIDVLPDLQQNAVLSRNVQRRGLLVLEELMSSLSPNARAEILEHLTTNITQLSTQASRRYSPHLANRAMRGLAVAHVAALPIIMSGVAVGATAITAASGGAAAGTIGLFALAAYLGTKKQVQGTALYLLKRQLSSLRKDWSEVDGTHREKLTRAFEGLRGQWRNLDATKLTTRNAFFNDDFINPARFPSRPANPVSEAARRQGNRIRAQLRGRFEPRMEQSRGAAVNPAPVSDPSRPSQPQSQQEQQLMEVVAILRRDAMRMNLCTTDLPASFLENVRLHAGGIPRWDSILFQCFNRISALADYENEATRPGLLRQVVAMTDRLANGDRGFVRKFIEIALDAQGDCGNRVQTVYQDLHFLVAWDEAMKGKDGLSKPAVLLALARQGFIRQVIQNVMTEYINERRMQGRQLVTPRQEVEAALLAEIAMGRRLGLRDEVRDMRFKGTVAGISRRDLARVEERVKAVIEDDGVFFDYLLTSPSVIAVIEADPAYQAELGRRVAPHRAEFEALADKALATGSEQDERAQEAAGTTVTDEEYHAAAKRVMEMEKEIASTLLRERLEAMVSSYGHGASRDAAPAADQGEGTAKVEAEPPMPEWLTTLMSIARPGDDLAHEREVARETMQYQHAARDPSLGGIAPADLPSIPIENAGGGDCLFLALNEPATEIRNALRQAIEAREDDAAARTRNAHNIASALSQTPEMAHLAADFVGGLHQVPNAVYAEIVGTPGIYAGEDELTVYSTLPANRGKIFLVIDEDGTVLRIQDGSRTAVPYDAASKQAELKRLVDEADVALYKTANHWRRLPKTT
ncbi:NEL domain-containing protein [Noviherbaspirillum aridicola]|uniref:NEL domain-containing protein n=1 Tax=Noviherbaspirillum aridicola TaxID=2849687 RepID=A0ABQ4Q742_9BURK|nr:NEL domain-containing protein [Noviherbaspirillum aridicola]GIZ52747.1 hypothetical protein NCCP691_27610 [Noviherbaspirillum aridicola]